MDAVNFDDFAILYTSIFQFAKCSAPMEAKVAQEEGGEQMADHICPCRAVCRTVCAMSAYLVAKACIQPPPFVC